MPTRRKFLRTAVGLPILFPITYCPTTAQDEATISQHVSSRNKFQVKREPLKSNWYMPEEGDPHERTWMSFGASEQVWGKRLIDEVRKNLALVAQTIGRFEPVIVCVRAREQEIAKKYFTEMHNIELLVSPLDDLWIRDFGAVYVVNEQGNKAAVDFNFNGWGEKQDFENDAQVAALMANKSQAKLLQTGLCLEGGGIEVDGEGTAIITESCVLNPNRNPEWKKQDVEDELLKMLGIEKVVWLPGVKGADITDGHTDFYARFIKPGVVVAHFDPDPISPENALTLRHREILEKATDANGKRLEVVMLNAPSNVRPKFKNNDFCAGYINFYVCNNAVLAPEFGDKRADRAAQEQLAQLFPGREIVLLNIDGIAAGGGGIHCATQQEPKV